MLKLKNDQKLYILKSDGKWFTCISNNDGLISYSDNLYIVDSQQGTTINIKSFQAAYDEIKNFDLEKEVEQLMSVEDYSALVDKVMHLQNILFEMSTFNKFVTESKLSEEFKKGTDLVYQQAYKKIENIETLFQTVAKNVPANWAYAMFPESSWTAYPFLVEKHKVASGNMTRFAESYGRTLNDAKEVDRNNRDLNEALNLDVHKEEKRFLDLQEKIRVKEQDKERIL